VIKNKFGSADNIPREEASSSWGEGGEEVGGGSHLHTPSHGHKRTQSGTVGGLASASRFSSQHTTNSLPRDSSAGGSVANSERRQSSFEEPASERSSVTSESAGGEDVGGNRWPEGGGSEAGKPEMLSPRHLGGLGGSQLGLESLMSEIHERREDCDRLTGLLELQKQHFKQELEYLGGQLREESIRCDRLEEQMNDLTELHQNEMELVKSGVTDMEEKVQYQSEERIRDIQEQLVTLQTSIQRMEHQQTQHHQLAALEGFENSNARALVVKGINVLLTLLQVKKNLSSQANSPTQDRFDNIYADNSFSLLKNCSRLFFSFSPPLLKSLSPSFELPPEWSLRCCWSLFLFLPSVSGRRSRSSLCSLPLR